MVRAASSVETNRPDAAVVYAVPMDIEQTQEPSRPTGAVYGEPPTTATVADGAPVYGEPLTTAYTTGVAVQGDQTYIFVRPRASDGKFWHFASCTSFQRTWSKHAFTIYVCPTSVIMRRLLVNMIGGATVRRLVSCFVMLAIPCACRGHTCALYVHTF